MPGKIKKKKPSHSNHDTSPDFISALRFAFMLQIGKAQFSFLRSSPVNSSNFQD